MKNKKIIKDIMTLEKLIHEPSRLAILTILSGVKEADFKFLLRMSGLTRGNLSVHLSKLEEAGYVNINKRFINKMPNTVYNITKEGRRAFDEYLKNMGKIINRKKTEL
ncbi:MAG: transcriptional regulator [candidate division WOR-3 bacterium]|jgi:DNA-binding transcriptional ArsR family regulator